MGIIAAFFAYIAKDYHLNRGSCGSRFELAGIPLLLASTCYTLLLHDRFAGFGGCAALPLERRAPQVHWKHPAMAWNDGSSGSSKEERPPLPPLLRWPGGKRLLLGSLRPLVPSQFLRYFEPFVGGGAVFFALRPANALLSDTNSELLDCYEAVRDHPRALLNRLSALDNTEETYYAMRESVPSSALARAVRVIYLTRLSFNGIFRVNREGRFNVPIGRRERDPVSAARQLLSASKALKGISLLCADFEIALSTAARGDFVFLDPPYTVAHANNGFRKYNARIFSWEDQERLANCMKRLDGLGCQLLMTNARHGSIASLYRYFTKVRLSRMSCIAALPEYRRRVQELIITNMI